MITVFIILGIFSISFDLFIPVPVDQIGQVLMIRLGGMMWLILGAAIWGIRQRQVGLGGFLNLPREDNINCFYQPAHSTNTRIIQGHLLEDNLIKTKNKLINYKGGGFRIAGHECIRVHGNIVSNIPEWLGEVLARYKEKYGVDDIYKLRALYDNLQTLKEGDLVKQLHDIPELSFILDEPYKLRQLESMPMRDIRAMSETLWDGTTIRMDPDIDEFIQTATPSAVHQYAQREYMSKKYRDKMLQSGDRSTLLKYAFGIGILIFMVFLGIALFLSVAGSL